MPLISLRVTGIRNIASCSISLHDNINIIVGRNGSGKSSLLEAIYLMFTGRSFRTQRVGNYIRYGEAQCLVSGDLLGSDDRIIKVGLQKNRSGKVKVKIGTDSHESVVPVARLKPIRIHTPEEPLLVDASAEQRRRFVDWALFHVEHDFADLWKKAQKLLRHRNSLIKQGIRNYSVIEPWDQQICPIFERIKQLRETHVNELSSVVSNGPFSELFSHLGLALSMYAGWNEDQPLSTQLKEGFERDILRGFSLLGIQRADLRIKAQDGSAKEVLSRGQKKAIALHLKMLQCSLVGSMLDRKTMFLLDDIKAEFDEENLSRLFHWLFEHSTIGQIFVTATDADDIEKYVTERSYSMFHVEHGDLKVNKMIGNYVG